MKNIAKFFFGTAVLVLASMASVAQGLVSDATEKAALLKFYTDLGGANWTASPSPGSNKWTDYINLLQLGSTTLADIKNAQTTNGAFPGLTITNNDVTALVFTSANNMVGSLPKELATLTELRDLSIYRGFVAGNLNLISGVLENDSNPLDNDVDFTTLTKLTTLVLDLNRCTGNFGWISALTNLTVLNLSNDNSINKLVGPLPSNIGNLVNLTSLNLSYNTITGTLPASMGNLDALQTLTLNACTLNQTSFPVEFGGMAALKVLALNQNPITNLPACIGSLTTLETLLLANTGVKTFPASFEDLDQLLTLSLDQNNYIHNDASATSDLSTMIEIMNGCAKLYNLYLSYSQISDLPANIVTMTALRNLTLNHNPIATSPATKNNVLGQLPLTSLYMVNCGLTSIPASLSNSTTLIILDLSNGINDNVTPNRINLNDSQLELTLKNIENLKSLNISRNDMGTPTLVNGQLPAWFGSEDMNKLTVLNLESNRIQLPLPANFASLTKLTYLNIANNQLAGSFSNALSGFVLLEQLLLNNNQLTGLPDLTLLTKLGYLYLSNNVLTGDFPAHLATLNSMRYIDITNNNYTSFPNFSAHPNRAQIQAFVGNNFLTFAHIEYNMEGINDPVFFNFGYTPQKQTGTPQTIYTVPGLDLELTYTQAGGTLNTYQWEKKTGSTWTIVRNYASGPYQIMNVTVSHGGEYRATVKNSYATALTLVGAPITLIVMPPLCETPIPPVTASTGQFKMDKLTGTIVFERTDCAAPIPITCVFGPSQGFDNVISASATTHSDIWDYSHMGNHVSSPNPFNSVERGKWREESSYVFNTPVNQANDKNYNAGTFKYRPFNYQGTGKGVNTGWLLTSQVTKYSPNGEPVEEVNALDIPGAAKFGYSQSVPYLTAKNSPYNSVLFESFENVYPTNTLEDGFVISNTSVDATTAHAGKSSLLINGITTVNIRSFKVTKQIKDKGMQVKVWLKEPSNGMSFVVPNLQLLEGATLLTSRAFSLIARTGEWALYQATIIPSDLTAVDPGDEFFLKIANNQTGNVWMDDLRVQPLDSEVSAYVYDKTTLRLMAIFDDQHFGLYYQYNAEGQLIRKIMETERGIKTIQETQYNTPIR